MGIKQKKKAKLTRHSRTGESWIQMGVNGLTSDRREIISRLAEVFFGLSLDPDHLERQTCIIFVGWKFMLTQELSYE